MLPSPEHSSIGWNEGTGRDPAGETDSVSEVGLLIADRLGVGVDRRDVLDVVGWML